MIIMAILKNMGYIFVTANPLELGTFSTFINKHGNHISIGAESLGTYYVTHTPLWVCV